MFLGGGSHGTHPQGQHILIREGTAARNLESLLPLFDGPFAGRCLLVTDDRHPADLVEQGHIDDIIRKAAAAGKDPVTGIRMATIQAAEYFGLRDVGAVAPGYRADLLVLEDLESVAVRDVYQAGKKVVSEGKVLPFADPVIPEELQRTVRGSFHLEELSAEDFRVRLRGRHSCRVIGMERGQLLTQEEIRELDFDKGKRDRCGAGSCEDRSNRAAPAYGAYRPGLCRRYGCAVRRPCFFCVP